MTGNPKNNPDPSQPPAPVDEQDTSSTPSSGTDPIPDDSSTTSPWIKPKTA
jgi:hypothetical protein